MDNPHMGTVRGLSIAVLVLSILALLGALALFLFGGVFGMANSDPTIANSIAIEIQKDNGSSVEIQKALGRELTGSDVSKVGYAVGRVFAVAALWVGAMAIVTIIAGILGIRNARKMDKLGGVMGWAIAGAVICFLCGRLISMILFILIAVFASKARKTHVIPLGQANVGANAYGQPYAQQSYQQPMYAQPTQTAAPTSAPQQTYAQPTGQQPLYQQPATQQPTGQQPLYTQPAGQQPADQQPVGQQPLYTRPEDNQ